jgi:hypothetical protein
VIIHHGTTTEQPKAKKHVELCTRLKEEYTLFHSHNFIVTASFLFQFTKRTNEEQKQMSNDSIEV